MDSDTSINATVDLRETLERINAEDLIDRRVSPGMLIIAPPMRLLHMNQTAWELMHTVSDQKEGNGEGKAVNAKGLLPTALHEVCAEIIRHLRDRTHAKDWERFEIKRLITNPRQPLLVRGFGVPDQNGIEHSRVILLLETIGRRKEELSEETKLRYQFTEREQAVLQCLGKGWTNKEIASTLKLALPTVKEHIRHIMDKTKTNTRTEILVQVYRM